MKKYTEVRRIFAQKLRTLCFEKNWYTRGTNCEYYHMLYDMAGDKENITTEDIVEIAQDILEHSDTDMDITSICFEVARISVTFFEEV